MVHSRLEGRSGMGHEVWWDVLFQSWMTINVAFLWIRRSVEILNTLSTMLFLKTNSGYTSICDRTASHMVPYVISIVAENAPHESTNRPQNTIPTVGILETYSAFQDEGMYALAVIDWLVAQHNELVQIVARILV